jgi:NMD protein affecting ribosome stability and mRNA decay
MVSNAPFIHRHNPDNTIDSICMTCFLTVASVSSETELLQREQTHNCERAIQAEWLRLYEVSQQGTF